MSREIGTVTGRTSLEDDPLRRSRPTMKVAGPPDGRSRGSALSDPCTAVTHAVALAPRATPNAVTEPRPPHMPSGAPPNENLFVVKGGLGGELGRAGSCPCGVADGWS